MNNLRDEKLVTIYVGENSRVDGKPVYLAILELLRSAGLTNVMVVRGIAGIDDAGRIHAAGVMTLSVDLPLKIEWVATTERVAELMPSVRKLVKEGVICVQSVGVTRLASKRKQNVLDQSVATIMTTNVASVTPATALVDAVTLLMQGGYHSVPVVDEDRKVVGIVTNGDLLRNSSLPIRLGLQPSLTDEQVQSDLRVLQGQNRQVGEIMTMPVTTVLHQQSMRHAGAIMVEKELKRLPVVDEKGVLVGIVSRVDILSALSNRSQIDKVETPVRYGRTVADLMVSDPPTVLTSAGLEEIVQALEESRQQRVVVVDRDRQVLGVITDGDLLRRSMYGKHPSLRSRLRGLITGESAVSFDLPNGKETAAEMMTSPPITLPVDATLGHALSLMLQHQLKRLPVVEAKGMLVGVLGRSSVLRGLLQESSSES